jgi:hypothetical protein
MFAETIDLSSLEGTSEEMATLMGFAGFDTTKVTFIHPIIHIYGQILGQKSKRQQYGRCEY